MYKPSNIKIKDRTNLGIIIFSPKSAEIEVANIGPKNQAKGKSK